MFSLFPKGSNLPVLDATPARGHRLQKVLVEKFPTYLMKLQISRIAQRLLLPLAVLGCCWAWAESPAAKPPTHITGRVVNTQTQEALAGIAIYVDGLGTGTYTDANGAFALTVRSSLPLTLVCAGQGFESQRVTITQPPDCDLHIALQEATVSIEQVRVSASLTHEKAKLLPAVVKSVDANFIASHRETTLSQTLAAIPGVHSMSIGNGMGKPMIRGMGFNRIAVVDRGIKQEGQQWGADHGLEFDQMAVQNLGVYKGAMGLQYGGDALGGAIVINDDIPLPDYGIHGNGHLWGGSNSWLLGASAGVGFRNDGFFANGQLTGTQYGDYAVPTDHIVYLTQRIPVYDRRMKNTAGHELDGSLTLGGTGRYGTLAITASHVHQKMGFFPGSHGVPSEERVRPDGNSRNIGLPYALAEHSKLLVNYRTPAQVVGWQFLVDLGVQRNHREEWAEFHTHYPGQTAPAKDADMELLFNLWTYSAAPKVVWHPQEGVEYRFGLDGQYQHHGIGGFNFLLPRYQRGVIGAYATHRSRINQQITVEGGLRVDGAQTRIEAYRDQHLANYLRVYAQADQATQEAYSLRAQALRRNFWNWSLSLGARYTPLEHLALKLYLGRSYRLPSVNELGANGVHHGSYRHEQGDPKMAAEQGYQLDAELQYDNGNIMVALNPFAAYYTNYIYLNPSGQWSLLPHAGQIYQFCQAQARMWGGEMEVHGHPVHGLTVGASGAFLRQDNLTDGYPLPFAPQTKVTGQLAWNLFNARPKWGVLTLRVLPLYLFAQERIARNEDTTPGHFQLNAEVAYRHAFGEQALTLRLACDNALDTKYFNHLSYYRQLGIPEPGRAFTLQVDYSF